MIRAQQCLQYYKCRRIYPRYFVFFVLCICLIGNILTKNVARWMDDNDQSEIHIKPPITYQDRICRKPAGREETLTT